MWLMPGILLFSDYTISMSTLHILKHYYPGLQNKSKVLLKLAILILNPLSLLQFAVQSLQLPQIALYYMVLSQLVVVNLDWRDQFYTDKLDLEEFREEERVKEEEEKRKKEEEEEKKKKEEEDLKGKDTVAKPKGKKKNKVAKRDPKQDEKKEPVSSPDLTRVQIPMMATSIACMFDPNMYFFVLPFTLLPGDFNTTYQVLIFAAFIASSSLENQYNILKIADSSENLGLFWYLYIETFRDYLGFFKVFYILVKVLVGLFNYSMAKD